MLSTVTNPHGWPDVLIVGGMAAQIFTRSDATAILPMDVYSTSSDAKEMSEWLAKNRKPDPAIERLTKWAGRFCESRRFPAWLCREMWKRKPA